VHYRNRADLLFGKFVGPLEVINFDLPAVRGGLVILRFGVSGVYCGE